MGIGRLLDEDWSGAIEVLESSLSVSRDANVWREGEGESLSFLATCHLERGDRARALELTREAIDVARDGHSPVILCHAHLTHAQALLAEGGDRIGEVDASLLEAEGLIERTGAEAWRPQVVHARSRLARLKGNETDHERHLREAHRLFVEMGATGHAERLAREMER
jgi:hypothetical protein